MKTAILVSTTIILAASAAFGAEQDNISVGPNDRVSIHINGVDDDMVCSIAGKPVLSSHFGWRDVDADITGALVKGQNPVDCKVSDNDYGSCFAYDYQIKVANKVARSKTNSKCGLPKTDSKVVLDDSFTLILQ